MVLNTQQQTQQVQQHRSQQKALQEARLRRHSGRRITATAVALLLVTSTLILTSSLLPNSPLSSILPGRLTSTAALAESAVGSSTTSSTSPVAGSSTGGSTATSVPGTSTSGTSTTGSPTQGSSSTGTSTTIPSSEPAGSTGEPFSLASLSDTPSDIAHSDKLTGSTETVDDSGIIHGTTPSGVNYTLVGRNATGLSTDKVSFCAVGDQIASDDAMGIAAGYAAGTGDGYDFHPFYQGTSSFIQSFDLRYINQETVCGGLDSGLGYMGYPTFNSPDSAVTAIADEGFNLIQFSSNHSYDMGTSGIERTHQLFAAYPQILVGGSYLSEEDRDTVHMVERNGITFAFLAYSYGDNLYGSDSSSMPNTYYECQFDYDQVAADVSRAKAVADVVIVGMHWGTEYQNDPSEEQLADAQYLADLGVDVVVGSHVHVMQTARYFTGVNGNSTLVMFGLSDFVSGWTYANNILSGFFTCDFVRQADGSVAVQNPAFYPCVEWSSDDVNVYVRLLKDMDEATTDANTRTTDLDNDYYGLRDKINALGMEIPVVM